MAIKFSWSCPYCNRDATITDSNYSRSIHWFDNDNKHGDSALITEVIICPNNDCKEYVISGKLHSAFWDHVHKIDQNIRLQWSLKPKSHATQFPPYIPQAIIKKYSALVVKVTA